MPDKPHRSRVGWRDMTHKPEDDDLVPGMPFHWHRPPKWIARCVIGLMLLGALNLSGLALSLAYDVRQQQYIEGRGEYRDREQDRMERESVERNRQAMCDLLDQFPVGGLLDRPREKYGCGPGIPIDQLSPQEQAQLEGRAVPETPAADHAAGDAAELRVPGHTAPIDPGGARTTP